MPLTDADINNFIYTKPISEHYKGIFIASKIKLSDLDLKKGDFMIIYKVTNILDPSNGHWILLFRANNSYIFFDSEHKFEYYIDVLKKMYKFDLVQ
jgi:hypothetical protein